MLKKFLKLRKTDLILAAIIHGAGFFIGEAVICLVMAIARPDTGVLIMHFVQCLSACILAAVLGMINFSDHFDLALRFGETRGGALRLLLGLTAVEDTVILILAGMFSLAERYLFVPVWCVLAGKQAAALTGVMPAGVPEDSVLRMEVFPFLGVTDNPLLLLLILSGLILAGSLFGFVQGALMQRFGPKGMFVWIIACYLPAAFSSASVRSTTAALLPMLITLFVALIILWLVWAVWSLLHASVK